MHLLLLVGPQSVETIAGNLGDQETDTGQITDGVTGTTETLNKDLVVLVAEGHTTVTGDECSDSLVVFFELDSDTLSNTGVRLLGLNTNLLDDDTTGVGSTLEWLSPLGGLMGEFVVLIGPKIQSSLVLKLATSSDTTRFMFSHVYCFVRYEIYLLITMLPQTLSLKPCLFNYFARDINLQFILYSTSLLLQSNQSN